MSSSTNKNKRGSKRPLNVKEEHTPNKSQKTYMVIDNVDTTCLDQLNQLSELVGTEPQTKKAAPETKIMYHTRIRQVDSKNKPLTSWSKSSEWINQKGLRNLLEKGFKYDNVKVIHEDCYLMNTFNHSKSIGKLSTNKSGNVIVTVLGEFDNSGYNKHATPIVYETNSPIKAWTDSIYLKKDNSKKGRNVSAGWSYTKPVVVMDNVYRMYDISLLDIKKELIKKEHPETRYVEFKIKNNE